MTYVPMAQRTLCPGCGAALNLRDDETLIDCQFCGTTSRIVRQLRRAEPRFSWELTQPQKEPDAKVPVKTWSFEELLYTLNTGNRPDLQEDILKSMNSWQRVQEQNLKWLPPLMNSLLHFPDDLSIKAAGIIGKFLCSKDLDLKNKVLDMIPPFLMPPKRSIGLVKATALANAAAVRMLLDTAKEASRLGDEEYALAALRGVQTAIGRERDEHTVAIGILLHQLFDFDEFLSTWVIKFIRLHFDVGSTDILGEALELLDEAVSERPDLVDGLLGALAKCRKPTDTDDLKIRLSAHRQLKTEIARNEALKLIVPTYPLLDQDVDMVLESLVLLCSDPLVANSVAKFVWGCKALKPSHKASLESMRPLPKVLERALEVYEQR